MNYREEVLKNRPDFEASTIEAKLTNGGLGVAGEAGEVADLIKKILFHVPAGSYPTIPEVMRQKLIHEIGDVHWYLEFLAATLGVSTQEILEANVAKLKARHPNGWTAQGQQEKKDEISETPPKFVYGTGTEWSSAVGSIYTATHEAILTHIKPLALDREPSE